MKEKRAGLERDNPPRVVLGGYYGLGNLGDEASLEAVVLGLRARLPRVELRILSGSPGATRRALGVPAVPRQRPGVIAAAIRWADLLILGGGSLFQDATSRRSLLYYLGLVEAAKLLGTQVYLWGQGLGPLTGRSSKALAARVLRGVPISVRDEESLAGLLGLGLDSSLITLSADPAFGLSPKMSSKVAAAWQQLGPVRTPVCVCPRAWPGSRGACAALARCCDRLVEDAGASPVMVLMQEEVDLPAAEEIRRSMRHGDRCRRLSVRLDASELLAFLERMELLVGMRLHALIFGAMSGVPLLGISYDPKVGSLMRRLESPAPSLAGLDGDALAETALVLLASRRKEGERIREMARILTEKAAISADLAVQILEEKVAWSRTN